MLVKGTAIMNTCTSNFIPQHWKKPLGGESKFFFLKLMHIVLSQYATALLMKINFHSVVVQDHIPYAQAVIPMKKPHAGRTFHSVETQ